MGADDKRTNSPLQNSNIIRDIPLIQRYARNNEADDFRFRTFLKSRLNMSTEAVDDIVRSTTDEVWQHIDCTKCANCCKTLPVVVDNARSTAASGIAAIGGKRMVLQIAIDTFPCGKDLFSFAPRSRFRS